MTDPAVDGLETARPSRRTLIAGAVWTVPVVAAAVAAPMAAASTQNASLRWSASETGLLSLRVLSSGSLLTAGLAVTVPTQFTITNGPGAIAATSAAVEVIVGRPDGINIPIGAMHGFGVYSLNGSVVASQNTVDYQSALGINYGAPVTTFTGSLPVSIASSGSLSVPIVFGLSGTTSLLSLSVVAVFPVTLIVTIGGRTLTASTTISVPVGAGLL